MSCCICQIVKWAATARFNIAPVVDRSLRIGNSASDPIAPSVNRSSHRLIIRAVLERINKTRINPADRINNHCISQIQINKGPIKLIDRIRPIKQINRAINPMPSAVHLVKIRLIDLVNRARSVPPRAAPPPATSPIGAPR